METSCLLYLALFLVLGLLLGYWTYNKHSKLGVATAAPAAALVPPGAGGKPAAPAVG